MVKKKPKVYLDVCCLNRPFDFQGDDRIKLETEAILIILSNIERKVFHLISSDIIEYEISKIIQEDRRLFVNLMLSLSENKIQLNNEIKLRAEYFETLWYKDF